MGRAESVTLPVEPTRARLLGDLLPIGLLAALYLYTMARDLGTIDSGELATVCATLGVAHPTGYPLYTLLGRIFVAGLPSSPILAVGLLSIAGALACAWFVLRAARELLQLAGVETLGGWVPRAAAFWFGSNRVFWEQAAGNEVYSMHLAIVACLLWLGLRSFRSRERGRFGLLLPYVAGLGAAHHLTVVFLLPALAWAWIQPWLRGARRTATGLLARLVRTVGIALLAYSVTLYLPIRSAAGPLLDWGGTTSWTTFWRHTLAAQYRVWLFESAGQFAGNLGGYATSLAGRVFPLLLIAVVLGAARLARLSSRALVFLVLVFVVTLLWAASYAIHDLEPYFLPADLVLTLLAAIGAAAVLGAGVRRRIVVAAALVLVTLAQPALVFRSVDRRGDRFVRAHAKAVLASVPDHAVLLSRFWDSVVSPWIYLREIEGLRPDVTVVDSELLRRSWYFPELSRWDKDLLAPLASELAAYRGDLALFEAGKRYDPRSIETHYRALIAGLALRHRPARPGAFTIDVLQDYPQEVQATFFAPAVAVPEGLCFVLRDRPEDSPRIPPLDPAPLFAAGFRADDRIHRLAVEQWRFMLRSRVLFLKAYQRTDEAAEWEAASSRLDSLLAAYGPSNAAH